jgi:poly-gamma-glutamate synthesis protein (capsule biosynthesis protein)
MPHWGPEDQSTPTWVQRRLAQKIVAAGADLVVGNHTHVVQGYQMLHGVMVFYGLGNFVFDQDLNDHQQGVILIVRFAGKQLLDFDLIPTHVAEDGRVSLAEESEAAEILQRIEMASQNLK